MLKFKKNIWLLFYLIVLIGTILLGIAVSHKYDGILQQAKREQQHHSHIYHNHLAALLREQEILQNVLANTYINNTHFNSVAFNTLLELNPLLLGLSIISKQGELQFTTFPDLQVPNLLQDKNTRQWFQQALETDQMVVGRAYLLDSINRWILPVRKRIVDAQGNIIAVISTGLDLTMLHNLPDDKGDFQNTMQMTLDNGAFPVLRSGLTKELYAQYYDNSLPEGQLLGQELSELKAQLTAQNSPYTQPMIQHSNDSVTGKLIYTLSYNSRYHFWTSAETPYQLVLGKLYQQGRDYLFLYLLLIVSIFTLFRWIIKNEIKKIDQLTYSAEHDALTGLANHTVIRKHFIEMQKEKQTPFALLYLKLDNFNNINKAFGHRYGHLILTHVAKRIVQSLLPCNDHYLKKSVICLKTGKACLVGLNTLATRYSGDEFVIFIESGDRDQIAECAKLILKNIAQPYVIDRSEFKVNASIGIACFPGDSVEIETLLSYADSSIERAQQRRNQYQFFSQNQHSQFTRNIEIEQALRHAMENKEITLVYQPQLDSKQKLVGVEALVRWHSDKLGFIAPDVFIPIAEKSGYIRQLGLYIMHQAMQEIAGLKKREELDFQLSINVSARQFMQGDFLKKLLEACTFHSIAPGTVTIEITESLFIERLDKLLPLFNKMKAHNITLSLDDFGTGYSSLSMLKKVPVDELKIDKSFVDHIATNSADNVMVENIINMGKALGMHIVAEGVEDKQQAALLTKAGCDIFQGYYFAKPLTLEALITFAKKHRKMQSGPQKIA
ncbi:EAL domain-containing protein [Psychromonas sp.]|uniref:bifunctional diguanylate cyclase/phosphodiesterase n=1 Tax=Psychromonas sp. TaxID=1884585 RepID=UPI0035684F19